MISIKTRIKSISTFWKFWEYQDSEGRNKTKDFPMEIFCTREKLPTETEMNEWSLVFLEKYQLKLLQFSIVIALLGVP